MRRSKLTDQVTELLQRYIAENELQPGEELPTEMELTQIFGVSRTVVREGLRTASALGLIDTESGKRSRVAPLSGNVLGHFFDNALRLDAEAIESLLEVRESLETLAVRLAAGRRDEERLRELRSHLEGMERALEKREYPEFVDDDVAFHLVLVEMSGNEILKHLLQALGAATRRSMSSGLSARRTPQALANVQELHNRIYRAIESGDEAGAVQAMTEHFRTAIAALRANQQN